MNSRNMEKDSNGWGRRDNRPNKFKKDFSDDQRRLAFPFSPASAFISVHLRFHSPQFLAHRTARLRADVMAATS